jgi:hypothetical protein
MSSEAKRLNELAAFLSEQHSTELTRRDGARKWDALGDRRAEALQVIADEVFESMHSAICDFFDIEANDGPEFDEDGYERAALSPDLEAPLNLVGAALAMFVLRQVDAEQRRAAKAGKAATERRARSIQ